MSTTAVMPRQEEDAQPEFEQWAAARWDRLLRTAFLLTGDEHEADDLLQATLAKVFVAWPRIRRLDQPDAYVHRAMVNTNLSRYRRRRVVQLLTGRVPERVGPAADAQVAERTGLREALAQLPPRQRAVVVLRYWEDLSEREVAQVLGCSVGNVKSQASRALRRLREHPALAGVREESSR